MFTLEYFVRTCVCVHTCVFVCFVDEVSFVDCQRLQIIGFENHATLVVIGKRLHYNVLFTRLRIDVDGCGRDMSISVR